MSEMIRKQFYIHKRHQLLLKKLARAKGVSEAEIVRQAIEREASGSERQTGAADRSAWEALLAAAAARRSLGVQAAPYDWDRQDAYQDRETRMASSGA